VGLRDDKHFKSINVQSFWYKTDPFILADQAKKIFYLQDTTPQCKDWRVVQKFEHRNIYDVAETEEGSHDVHQDDYCNIPYFYGMLYSPKMRISKFLWECCR